MKILSVDDKAENLYMLEALLRGHGHEVDSASNGHDALQLAERGQLRPHHLGHPHAAHGRLSALPGIEKGRAAATHPVHLLHRDLHRSRAMPPSP